MIPDTVRLHNVEKLKNFDFEALTGRDGVRIAAFPVDKQYQCSQLKVDLRLASNVLYKELLASLMC